jgi:hypothetical protein
LVRPENSCSNDQQPIGQSLKNLAKNNEHLLHNPVVEMSSLWVTGEKESGAGELRSVDKVFNTRKTPV